MGHSPTDGCPAGLRDAGPPTFSTGGKGGERSVLRRRGCAGTPKNWGRGGTALHPREGGEWAEVKQYQRRIDCWVAGCKSKGWGVLQRWVVPVSPDPDHRSHGSGWEAANASSRGGGGGGSGRITQRLNATFCTSVAVRTLDRVRHAVNSGYISCHSERGLWQCH